MRKVEFKIVAEFPDWMTDPEDQLDLAIDVLESGMFRTSNKEPYNDRRLLSDECSAKEIKPPKEHKFIVASRLGRLEVSAEEWKDIVIVQLNDGFFDIQRPVYVGNIQHYEKPIKLLKANDRKGYIEYEIIRKCENDD